MKLLSERTILTLVVFKLHWFIFLYVWMFDSMYLCASLLYVCGSCGSQETRVGSSGFEIVDGHEPQYCCWEGNLSFLKEQQLLYAVSHLTNFERLILLGIIDQLYCLQQLVKKYLFEKGIKSQQEYYKWNIEQCKIWNKVQFGSIESPKKAQLPSRKRLNLRLC